METYVEARYDVGRKPYRFTAAQVLDMVALGVIDDDVELWDGVVHKMVKGELHNFIVGQIGDMLRPMTPSGYHLREEKSAKLDEHSIPEADLAVCRGNRGDYYPDLPGVDQLALVVEVDHHSHRADRIEKLAAYAKASIPCYWIVDADGGDVEVCAKPLTTETGATYAERRTFVQGDTINVTIDGRTVGTVDVAGMFPRKDVRRE